MFTLEQQMKLSEFQEQIKNISVYRYDINDENKYISEESVQLDQMSSLKNDRAVFYISANCTQIKVPNIKDGEIALFDKDNNKWEVVKDYKGKRYYDVEENVIKEINTHRFDKKIPILTEEDEQELSDGKSVKIVKGKYVFYFTDEQLKEKIIEKANSILNSTDFYFYKDYPVEKIPSLMGNYREYLRTINSEKNLKDKDVQNLQVLTYEEFINL